VSNRFVHLRLSCGKNLAVARLTVSLHRLHASKVYGVDSYASSS
jgi:hypothetical protein